MNFDMPAYVYVYIAITSALLVSLFNGYMKSLAKKKPKSTENFIFGVFFTMFGPFFLVCGVMIKLLLATPPKK